MPNIHIHVNDFPDCLKFDDCPDCLELTE